MLPPDSPVTVALMAAAGVGLVVLTAVLGRQWRSAAAALPGAALLLATGALAVNVQYGYYQRWADLVGDATSSGALAGPVSPAPGPAVPPHPGAAAAPVARHPGRLLQVNLGGGATGLDRTAVVWLPAGYDDSTSAARRYPVLMLLHGDPGEARGFIYGMHVDDVAQRLERANLPPYVIVMPTTWRGWHGQQCLNAVQGGPPDETYLVRDVPAALARVARVLPPGGRNWVLAGLSEGGYCALNLALRHRTLFAGAGSLDGYGEPDVARGVGQRLFGGSAALQRAATPLLREAALPAGGGPPLWLQAGDADRGDVAQETDMAAAAQGRSPVREVLVHGGNHTTPSWRAALPDLLGWAGDVLSGRAPRTGRLELHL